MSTTLALPAQAPAGRHSKASFHSRTANESESTNAFIGHPDTPDRWQQAHERAIAAGIKVYELGRGRYAVTSAHHEGRAYEVSVVPETCTCRAATFGDSVCIHRAAVRAHLNPEPEPPAHKPYDQTAEALMWAENDLQRAYKDIERYTARIERGDILTDREFLAFELAQQREQDAHSRIVALKAEKAQVAA